MENSFNEEEFIKKYKELASKYDLPTIEEVISLLENKIDFSFADDFSFLIGLSRALFDEITSINNFINEIMSPQTYSSAQMASYLKKFNRINNLSKLHSEFLNKFVKCDLKLRFIKSTSEAASFFKEVFSYLKNMLIQLKDLFDFEIDNLDKSDKKDFSYNFG